MLAQRAVTEPQTEPALVVTGLTASYGRRTVIEDVSLTLPARATTALIGPSGAGKSTLLRCLNRLHEARAGARSSGSVRLGDRELLDGEVRAREVRRRIGMVFSQPNPFPAMTILQDVTSGLRHVRGERDPRRLREVAEEVLRDVGLWNEVRDRLDRPSVTLSAGQQQRLCIARALATEPEVLLMDEPTIALDPVATAHIEELIAVLSERLTVFTVTHNMQQAARISSYTAFIQPGGDGAGRLVEFGSTLRIFTNPGRKETDDFISGRFG